jgi:histone demethylase JARID1
MEIRRQLSMGRANLPTVQPPGSVDGLEMFGFSSPAIVQVRKAFHLTLATLRNALSIS